MPVIGRLPYVSYIEMAMKLRYEYYFAVRLKLSEKNVYTSLYTYNYTPSRSLGRDQSIIIIMEEEDIMES